jgi:hypothetical protein
MTHAAMALATIRANAGRNTDPSVVPQSAINTPLAKTIAALAQRSQILRDPLSPPSTAIALLP